MSSTAKLLLIASAAALVVIAVLAGLYFTVLKGAEVATGPAAVVVRYFDAISTGDVDTVKSLYVPEAQPPQATLDALGQLYGAGMIKYEDVQVNTLSETATEAEVRLVDAVIKVSMGGQSQSTRMSSMLDTDQMVFKLRKLNGNWLISGEAGVLSNPSGVVPGGTVPSTGST